MSRMKRFLAYLVVLFVTIASYAEKTIIIGNGPGLKDSLDVTLFHKQGQTGTMKASARIQNGSFRLTVPVDSGLMETILCVFNPLHPTLARTIYLRPGAKVEIDAADHSDWIITGVKLR